MMAEEQGEQKISELLRALNDLGPTEKASVIAAVLNEDAQLKSEVESSFTKKESAQLQSESSSPTPSLPSVPMFKIQLNLPTEQTESPASIDSTQPEKKPLPSPSAIKKEEQIEPARPLINPASIAEITASAEYQRLRSAIEATMQMKEVQRTEVQGTAKIIEEEVILPPEWPKPRRRYQPTPNRRILPTAARNVQQQQQQFPTTPNRFILPGPPPPQQQQSNVPPPPNMTVFNTAPKTTATLVPVTDLHTLLNSYYNVKEDTNNAKEETTKKEQVPVADNPNLVKSPPPPPEQQQPPLTPLTPPQTTEDSTSMNINNLENLIQLLQDAINYPNGGMVLGGEVPTPIKTSPGGKRRMCGGSTTPHKKLKHSGGSHGIQLWQFILELLGDRSHRPVLSWTGRGLEFKISNSVELARLWGVRKRNPIMNFDKLSRALRYYYEKNIIKHNPVHRLVYSFCENPDDIVYNALLNQALETRPVEGEVVEPGDEEVIMSPSDVIMSPEELGPLHPASLGDRDHPPTQPEAISPERGISEGNLLDVSVSEALAGLVAGQSSVNLESVCGSLAGLVSQGGAGESDSVGRSGRIGKPTAGGIPIKVETPEEWI